MSIQRWSLCRQCGMVKDTGKAHGEYSKYEEEGPYYVLYADHVKEVNRASETYYQRYIDALWQVSYLTERIYYYLEGENGE